MIGAPVSHAIFTLNSTYKWNFTPFEPSSETLYNEISKELPLYIEFASVESFSIKLNLVLFLFLDLQTVLKCPFPEH